MVIVAITFAQKIPFSKTKEIILLLKNTVEDLKEESIA